jgi:F420-non-reducing hydrogenase large subunit
MKQITVSPVTRLEGHGKIEIFMNNQGNVDRAYLVVDELRGFENFSIGRQAEDMPQITQRICGVCPMAHHMAAVKAVDDLFGVQPTKTARMIRELLYNMFMLEDHALHFYVLGGPDFIVGPQAPKAERNILGVIQKVGIETGKKVIESRKLIRDIMQQVGGRTIHPVFGLPGGVSKAIKKEDLEVFRSKTKSILDFGKFTMDVFRDIVIKNKEYVDLITSDAYKHETYYMGLVKDKNIDEYYDGLLRVVDPKGREYAKFDVHDYQKYIGEHNEPWTLIRFPYLKEKGWKGFEEGPDSGVYSVAPLARLNVSDGMSTPLANNAYKEFFETIGERPVHYTLANHWARVIELLNASEKIVELLQDDEIAGKDIRNMPKEVNPTHKGFGVVEAPRGTLIHMYESDDRALLTKVDLLVATQHNAARLAMSVDKAAKSFIKNGKVTDGLLNMVEMAYRAYDPCFGCATHTATGMPIFDLYFRDQNGKIIKKVEL